MTRRATHLIGKPVVSAATGERLGTVSDLLLDDAGTSLVGLVLSHGWLKGEHVLPAESLQTLGTDAVVSRSNETVAAKEWLERQRAAARDTAAVPDPVPLRDPAPLPDPAPLRDPADGTPEAVGIRPADDRDFR